MIKTREIHQIISILLALLLLALPAVAQDTGEQVVSGTIDNETPFASYSVAVDESGSTIILDLAIDSGDLDTVLYLVDSAGTIIAENDDRSRQDYSSFIRFPNAPAGQYRAIAARYNVETGETTGTYTLTIRVEPDDRTVSDYDLSDEAIAAAGFPEIDARSPADWTVIGYYGGDTNLEPGVMYDFNEFERAGGSTDSVRVVMLMDRHPEYADGSGDWKSVRIFEMGPDVSADYEYVYPPTLDTEPLVDLGPRDTGDGELLAQYLVWASKNFPADRYAVAFASHGAAWKGLITDDTADHTIIEVPQLERAFAAVTEHVGFDKFDVLINDACLMSNVEYFGAVAPYFQYSIASPEVIIDPAHDMNLFTSLLNDDPAVDITTLGRNLVDTYIERDIQIVPSEDTQYYTSAVTSMTDFPDLIVRVEAVAEVINASPAEFTGTISSARNNVYTYSHFLGDNEVIDLGDFMRALIRESEDPQLTAAAEAVLQTLDQVRIYGAAGSESLANQISFYNIYFPRTAAGFDEMYFDLTPMPKWGQMLRSYYNGVSRKVWDRSENEIPFHAPLPPDIEITSIYPTDQSASIEFTVEVGLELVGRGISTVDSTIDRVNENGNLQRYSSQRIFTDIGQQDGTVRLENYWEEGVDVRRLFWDVQLPQVTDGTNSYLENLRITRGNEGIVASLDGYYREPGSETYNLVSLMFGDESSVTRVINRADGNNAVAVIPLDSIPVGSEFIAFRTLVSSDGAPQLELGNRYVWSEEGLSWQWVPAPSGTYNYGLLATNYGGLTDYDSVEIDVNNDNVTGEYLANTFSDFGVTVLRPLSLDRMAFFFEPFVYIRGASEDGSENVTIYLLDPQDMQGEPVPDDPVFIAERIAEKYGLTMGGDVRDITINGNTYGEFDYTYARETGSMTGRGIVRQFDAPFGSFGMVVAYEQLNAGESFDAVYEHLRETTVFFDPIEFAMSSTADWRFQFGETFSYPVRLDWQVSGSEDSPWLSFIDADYGEVLHVAVLEPQSAASVIDAHVRPQRDEITITDEQVPYVTLDDRAFDVALYDAVRDGTAVTGRVYVTTLAGQAYAFWIEAPNDVAPDLISNQLELVIDGFSFNSQYLASLEQTE